MQKRCETVFRWTKSESQWTYLFLIYSIEFAIGKADARQIESYADGALLSLSHYSLQHLQWVRYGKLLLALRNMSLQRNYGVLQHILQNIINEILEDSV